MRAFVWGCWILPEPPAISGHSLSFRNCSECSYRQNTLTGNSPVRWVLPWSPGDRTRSSPQSQPLGIHNDKGSASVIDYKSSYRKAERKSWSCLFTVTEHFVTKVCRWQKMPTKEEGCSPLLGAEMGGNSFGSPQRKLGSVVFQQEFDPCFLSLLHCELRGWSSVI